MQVTALVLSPARDFEAIQARVRQTLDRGVQIDLSTESCKRLLRRHVNCKIGVAILYVDIDGSTKMSMSLPAAKFGRVLQVFSQEMSLAVAEHGGYVLKYVGDAVIAIFPGEYDRVQASKSALDCAREMQQIIKNSINPELKSHGLPELRVKVALDYGEVLVVLYGKSLERSHVDIVGSSISMAAKMLALVQTGMIIVGQALRDNLSSGSMAGDFTDFKTSPSEWSYLDEKSGSSYRLYLAE